MTAPITTKKPAGVILLLLIIAVAGTAGCTAGGLFSHKGVLYPRIVPNTSAPAVHNPSYSFPFEDGTVNVSIPVNNPVYAGAKAADKDVIIYGNVSEAPGRRKVTWQWLTTPARKNSIQVSFHNSERYGPPGRLMITNILN